jgi:hypothetical protein
MEAIVALGLILGAAHAYDHFTGDEDIIQAQSKPTAQIAQTLPSVGIHRVDQIQPKGATNVIWVFTN